MMRWVVGPLCRYARFSGRADRREFWLWILFVVAVAGTGLVIVGLLPDVPPSERVMPITFGPRDVGALIFVAVMLALLLPTVAVSARRLHDIDRPLAWLFIPPALFALGFCIILTIGSVVALIGGLVMLGGVGAAGLLLVFLCLEGTSCPNRFGPDPHRSLDDIAERFA